MRIFIEQKIYDFLSSSLPLLPIKCGHFVYFSYIQILSDSTQVSLLFYKFSDDFYNGHKLLVVYLCEWVSEWACVERMYKENIENETENVRFNWSANEVG